jgi:hypothetical protein
MIETADVNASPLICLSRAGLANLLRQGAQTIVVPAAVAREILARGPPDVTAHAERRKPRRRDAEGDWTVAAISRVRWSF